MAPNVLGARDLLGPRGVQVIQTDPDGPLPFLDGTFELVTARHPVRPAWAEIYRVLKPRRTGFGVQLIEHSL